MDPNSFNGKVWFSVIDKVILGIFAGAVAWFFQFKQYEYQKRLDTNIAVSRMNTDVILVQRQKLMDEMGKYCLLLSEIGTSGKVNDHQMKSLTSHRLQMNLFIDTLGVVDQKIEEAGKPFLTGINNLNHDLTTKIIPKKNIMERINLIQEHYKTVLTTVRLVGLEKAGEEIKDASRQALASRQTKMEKAAAPK